MKSWPLLALGLLSLPALAQDPEQVRWLVGHSTAVRSIEPADEDFSDLMPLVQVIGQARVVQLGEATHGDGATFDRQPFSDGYSRDAAMAENLLWWVNGPLKDRKVIVWTHNYHVMHDVYGRTASPGVAPVREARLTAPGGPMGRFLKDELGSGLYSIGFDSFGGSVIGEEDKLVPVVPGALETLLHGVGRPALFLDLSRLPADHWLRTPMTGNFYFHEPYAANWTRVFDGIFFLDVQKPSSPW